MRVAKEVVRIAGSLDDWLARVDRSKSLSGQRGAWLRERVADLEELLAENPSALDLVATEFVDLAGFGLVRMPGPSDFLGGAEAAQVRAHGLRALERLTETEREGELLDWVTRGVLAEARRHPKERRWVALYLLRGMRSEAFDQTLLCIARDPSDPLRADALRAMPVSGSDGTDRYLVELLDLPRDPLHDPHPFDLLRQRLKRGQLGSDAEASLATRTKSMLLSSDWRDASRALAIIRGVDPMRSAPMLIEALHAWKVRQTHLGGARRLVHEIVRELQDLSGKTIGANPRNWTTWWQGVCNGSVPLHESAGERGRPVTTAAFLGLEPVSDRVTFLIDHSGSMQEPWNSTSRSRWVEVIEQLVSYLHASGEDTLFDVVLFDTTPTMSTNGLVAATPEILERLRSSLVGREPNGGTNLKLAVERALRVDAQGRVDAARVHSDTVVILCDGATAEGPGWVAPFVERIDAELRVVFHCVLIGPYDDGTLEALARATGGEFLRVDP